MRDDESPRATAEKARRDEGFAEAERVRREASLAATPAERLAWLEEAIAFAWAAGALKPRTPPPEWDDVLAAADAASRG